MKKTLTYCDACGRIIDESQTNISFWRGTLNFTWYDRSTPKKLLSNDTCARCTIILKDAIETAAEECKHDPPRNEDASN